MKYLLLLIVFNCILFYIYAYKPQLNEQYANSPMLIYDVQTNKEKLNIVVNDFDYSVAVSKTIQGIKNVRINSSSTRSSNDAFMIDVLSYITEKPEMKLITVPNESKVLLFMKPKDRHNNESLVKAIENDHVIGYLSNSDMILVQYLSIALGLHPTKVKLKRVIFPAKITQQWFKKNEIYALCMTICLTNTKLINRIPIDFKIDFLQYDGYDVNKLKFFIPFAKIQSHDLSVYFKSFQDKYSVKGCISLDIVLVGSSNLEANDNLGLELNTMLVKLGNYDVVNFYLMFFASFKHTSFYVNTMNKHVQTRNNLPILEQFEQGIVTFDIATNKNIDGFYDAANNKLIVNTNNIDGIPLSLNTRVLLRSQTRDEENGRYFVVHTDKNSTLLQKRLIWDVIQPVVKDGIIELSGSDKINGMKIEDIDKTDFIFVSRINKVGKLEKDRKGRFIVRLVDNIVENPTNDPRYECYNQQQIKSRGLCESSYDASGKKPKKSMSWDRRCESNEECPFYQANKNYKNYFGGCIDGYCQMPLGVKSISYRKYDTNNKPFCYNCRNRMDPFCCEEQKVKNKYPDLISPDYAFPLDQHERMQQLRKSAGRVAWFNK